MNLLQDIQESIIQEDVEIAPILLKLRLLAARLGSQELEDWVKYESEGYPSGEQVPEYRIIPVSYAATFSGPLGSGIKNAPIPSYLIDKFAGEGWNHYRLTQGVAGIDALLDKSSKGSGAFHINASNLILLLQGNVYEGYVCNSVDGTVSGASLAEIKHAVRSRVLELTIELEKIPGASEIKFGGSTPKNDDISKQVAQISQQIIYGDMHAITNTGHGAHINLTIQKGDSKAFIKCLVDSGIQKSDAEKLADIVESEPPGDEVEPFGEKAKKWLVENIKKTTDGTWKIGVSVATEVIKEAVLKYYGLK